MISAEFGDTYLYQPGISSNAQVLEYLCTTASTVLGLVLVILLSAVLLLGLVLDRQSTWTWQILSQILSYAFLLHIWIKRTQIQCTQILGVHQSSFSIFIYLYLIK